MTQIRERIRLIREVNKLYQDHADSLTVYSETTGAEVDLDQVEQIRAEEVKRIVEATEL